MEIIPEIVKGGTTSLVALTVTYPIDIWKINNQSKTKTRLNLKKLYRGFSRSGVLTFPEKGIKLGVYKYLKDNSTDPSKYNPMAATLSASAQSIFATPIENIKISNLHKKPIKSYYNGINFILSRDILFNLIFFYSADNNVFSDNNIVNNTLSGSLATSIVTPIDFIKTRYQELQLQNKKFSIKKLVKTTPPLGFFSGILGRNLSVGIFYGISYTLFNYF